MGVVDGEDGVEILNQHKGGRTLDAPNIVNNSPCAHLGHHSFRLVQHCLFGANDGGRFLKGEGVNGEVARGVCHQLRHLLANPARGRLQVQHRLLGRIVRRHCEQPKRHQDDLVLRVTHLFWNSEFVELGRNGSQERVKVRFRPTKPGADHEHVVLLVSEVRRKLQDGKHDQPQIILCGFKDGDAISTAEGGELPSLQPFRIDCPVIDVLHNTVLKPDTMERELNRIPEGGVSAPGPELGLDVEGEEELVVVAGMLVRAKHLVHLKDVPATFTIRVYVAIFGARIAQVGVIGVDALEAPVGKGTSELNNLKNGGLLFTGRAEPLEVMVKRKVVLNDCHGRTFIERFVDVVGKGVVLHGEEVLFV